MAIGRAAAGGCRGDRETEDMMRAALWISRGIDGLSELVGRWVYWLILVAVLVSAGNALTRKLFNMSSNAWLELQWYLFTAVFMLAAAYTLRRNEHIRIDIVSNMLPQRARNWIDIVGHCLFLLPMAAIMTYELEIGSASCRESVSQYV